MAVIYPGMMSTRCGMPRTCWDHCRPPNGGNLKRTWPTARRADSAVGELSGMPALLSQLDRDELATIDEATSA